MKSKYFTKFIILFTIYLFSVLNSEAQQKGAFETMISFESSNRAISCFVPYSYNSSNSYPLIIGMHPGGQTPEWVMRDMMLASAEQLNAILVCPQDFQYDGQIIPRAIEWAKDEYNIDPQAVVITGYSAGGNHTFNYSFNNPDVIRGIIGIAPAVNYYSLDYSVTQQLPVGLLVGGSDSFKSSCDEIKTRIENAGGYVKMTVKSGVGHTGPYFYSPEFTSDWVELYEFIFGLVFKPNAVTLSLPEDDAENLELPVTFEWDEISDVISYRIEVSETQSFSTFVDYIETPDNSYRGRYLQSGKEYYWRVRATNEGGDGEWSTTRSFTTMPDAPEDIVVTLYPEDNAERIPVSCEFGWNNIEDATKYHIQIRKDGTENLVVDNDNIDSKTGTKTFHQITDLENETKYNWRIRGGNVAGWSEWTEYKDFTTIMAAPQTAPVLVFPQNNSIDQELSITHQWNSVDNSSGYTFELSEGLQNPQVVFSSTIEDNSEGVIETLVEGLKEEMDYQWRVRAENEGGESPWSEYWSFKTKSLLSVDSEDHLFFGSIVSPNPVFESAMISFNIDSGSDVKLSIYDATGVEVSNLIDEYLVPQHYNVSFDTEDLESGFYFYSLQSGLKIETGKIIVLK